MRDTNSNDYFFTDDDIEIFLDEVVTELYPMTYQEKYLDSMITPDGSTKVFTFSTGVTRLTDIELINSSGENQGSIKGWKIRERYVIFDEAPSSGNTIRCWVEKKFLRIAEVPEQWDGYILNKIRLKAYETFEADRSKYYKYNSVVKPEGGSLPSLDKVITRIEIQILKREKQMRRTRKPAEINLTGV